MCHLERHKTIGYAALAKEKVVNRKEDILVEISHIPPALASSPQNESAGASDDILYQMPTPSNSKWTGEVARALLEGPHVTHMSEALWELQMHLPTRL